MSSMPAVAPRCGGIGQLRKGLVAIVLLAATALVYNVYQLTSCEWLEVTALPRLPADATVFLLETSGRSALTPREWCAVESAARAHPHHRVVLLASAPWVRASPLAGRILGFNNTLLARLNYSAMFERTPLEGWHRSGRVRSSPWAVVHTSDAVRLAALYKYGGIYVDTDVVVLRSLAELPDGAGLERDDALGNSVLKFSRRSPLPAVFATRFADHYDPAEWSVNGPRIITDVLTERCGQRSPPLKPAHCGQYDIFDSNHFFPVQWPEWGRLLDPAVADDVLAQANASYIVHTWGKETRAQWVRVGSAYHQLARRHCPISSELGGSWF